MAGKEELRKTHTMKFERYDKKLGRKVSTDYFLVAGRIIEFRNHNFTDYGYETEIEQVCDRYVVKCTIRDKNGMIVSQNRKEIKFPTEEEIAASKLHYKDKGYKALPPAKESPIETAETGALGRALGGMGYGTLAGDFDEGDQLADAPVNTQEVLVVERDDQLERALVALSKLKTIEQFNDKRSAIREFAKSMSEESRLRFSEAVSKKEKDLTK